MFKLKWVPLTVLQKALIEKNHREVALFLYLKMTSDGRVKLDGRKKGELLQVLSITESTLYRRLKVLLEWNWVGYDRITQIYFIRGYKFILRSEGSLSNTVVHFQSRDIFNLQAYAFSANVGFLLRSQRRNKRRGAEQKTWRSQQSPASFYKPIALNVMGSIFSLSKGTVIRLKKLSIQSGYLKRERSYKDLYHVSKHTKEYYRQYPEHWGLLRRNGAMISIIQPDTFIDFHTYKTKKY